MAAGDKYITNSNKNIGVEALLKSMALTDANGKPYFASNKVFTPPYVPPLKLYFGVNAGGANNNGTFVEFNLTTEILTKKVDFLSASTGATPFPGIKKYSNGKYYGCTNVGGSSNNGTLFEYDLVSGTVTKLINFVSATNGASPYYPPTETSDGRFFGTTGSGGTGNRGCIYEFFPLTNTVTLKQNFNSNTYGVNPRASLVEFNGKLYGVTQTGLTGKLGSIYEYDWVNDIITNKYDFTGFNSTPGVGTGTFQVRPMVLFNNEFYGISQNGGAFNGTAGAGTIWKYNANTNTFTYLQSFNAANVGGQFPIGFTLGSDNVFYIPCTSGGTNNTGGIYSYNPLSDSLVSLYSCPASGAGTKGALPIGPFTQVDINKYYACTALGGTTNQGTLYELDSSNNTVTKKYDFTTANGTGISPNGTIIYSE